MVLVMDVGNTNISIGVYKEKKLLASWRMSSSRDSSSDEFGLTLIGLLRHQKIDENQIKGVVISNVVPPIIHSIESAIRKYFNITPVIVGPGLKTGINIRVENPREVGADIIANTVAAFEIYGGPVIVVDFGTATTFSIINSKGDYIGAVICPGIKIASEALFQRTAKLPRIDLFKPNRVIGKNSITGMQSGIIYGYTGQIKYLIRLIKREMGEKNIKVIATGGPSVLLFKECESIDEINENLTLEGLRIIYEKNT